MLSRGIAAVSIAMLGLCTCVPAAATGDKDRKLELETRSEEATELDPIVVTPQVNPLDEQLFKLRKLVDDSSPCLGCGAGVRPKTFVEKYLLTGPPPEPTEMDKTEAYVRCSERGQEMDYLCNP